LSGAALTPLPPRAQLQRALRRRLSTQLYDTSGEPPCGIAIYWLADPRALREIRYVGQSAAPRRRLLQHLSVARLWLPDELPWWVRSPRLRPLYCWIRELYRDDARLPVMVVCAWVEAAAARVAERNEICACLARQLPLLNAEGELRRRQPRLL
jgi:hypothetical protein